MSDTEDRAQPTSGRTEIILVTGDHHCVEGNARDVERIILDAARGSLMQLAWLTDVDSRRELGVNPDHVVLLRSVEREAAG